MRSWKRRLKGAISIFLVIVIVANYALLGVLVDSARQRMAAASAEMALDTAASSVLSYYDKMVYDLYGLFAVDSLSESDIKTKLEEYTKKSLGLIPVDEKTTTKLTQAVTSAIFGGGNKPDSYTPFDGYDFKIDEVRIFTEGGNSAGNQNSEDQAPKSLTLANTNLVEAQIIDHMKYRAPVAIGQYLVGADDDKSFLSKLKSILNMKDRIEKAIEKNNDTSDKDSLCTRASNLIATVTAFNNKLKEFSTCGTVSNPPGSGGSKAYSMYTEVKNLDDKSNDICNQFEEIPEETEGEDNSEEVDQIIEERRKELRKEKDEYIKKVKNLCITAGQLYEEANSIYSTAEKLDADFKTYIDKLQRKVDQNPDNENVKTLYEPEIQIAKSTCGEMLKNIAIVLSSRPYTDSIAEFAKDVGALDVIVNCVIERRLGLTFPSVDAVNTYDVYHVEDYGAVTLRSYIEKSESGQDARECFDGLNDAFETLFDYTKTFKPVEEVKVDTKKANYKEKDESEKEETYKKDDLRNLNSEDVKINFQKTEQPWDLKIGNDLDSDNIGNILTAGLNLLKKIEEVLEDARDSLYINEYIISYFPNYVDHYSNAQKTSQKIASATLMSNARLIDSNDYYHNYNATLAEMEYVLSGETNTALSVAQMGAKLTAVRMLFNTVAIFTDSGMVAQANAMAAAISGPFAPLVSVVLLVAWALAESIADTVELMSGNSVLVFKQGANWTCSAQGLVKGMIEKGVKYIGGKVSEALNNQVDLAAGKVKEVANSAIYEAFNAADQGMERALKRGEAVMDEWANSLIAIDNVDSDQAKQQLNEVAGAVKGKLSGIAGNVKLKGTNSVKQEVLQKVSGGVDKIAGEAKAKIQNGVDALGDKLAETISSGVSRFMPEVTANTGDATGAGEPFDIKLDYLDYARIFLMFYGNSTKVQRIQQLIQANIRYGGRKGFRMENAYASVSAKMKGSIKYMFMSNAIMPSSMRRDGRLSFNVYTSLSY